MHPYEFLKKRNPNGFDQFVSEIKQRLAEVESYIVKFAEEAGQPELADKDALYALFQRGVSENLVYGLHELFKHYYCIFKKQILNEMIGVPQFDERDTEILKYFHDDFEFVKDCHTLIRIECPSVLVFETTFSIALGSKVTRYVNLFYKPMAYSYEAFVRACGGKKIQWNPSIKVEDLFVFDIPESTIIRNVSLKRMTNESNDHLWIRSNSELRIERTQSWRKNNQDKVAQYEAEYKSIRDSSRDTYKNYTKRGLVRIKVDGKFTWVNKSDTIVVYVEDSTNHYRYALRSRATKEQIVYYESHLEEIENKFHNRYKNCGVKKRGWNK